MQAQRVRHRPSTGRRRDRNTGIAQQRHLRRLRLARRQRRQGVELAADQGRHRQSVPQQQPGAPFTETDRYGNTFVYNDPAAPMCARGPMVKATRMKRDNSGTYTMWLDPAHKACPLWKKQGNPPVDPSQLAPDQWLNKR